MASKLSESVHVMVDNRLSGGTLLEASAKRCAHCRRIVVLNPMRTRKQNWCSKCDAYVCDNASCNLFCEPFDKVIDDFVEAGAKELPFALPPNK